MAPGAGDLGYHDPLRNEKQSAQARRGCDVDGSPRQATPAASSSSGDPQPHLDGVHTDLRSGDGQPGVVRAMRNGDVSDQGGNHRRIIRCLGSNPASPKAMIWDVASFLCPAASDSVSTYIPNILGISKNAYQKD